MRIGLVGAGFAARFHLDAYQRVYGVPIEVVGVTSTRAASREAPATEHHLRAFPDLDSLLAAVDVVDICSPGNTHEVLACRALAAGRHVILEKPFTGSYEQSLVMGADEERGTHATAALRAVQASCRRMRQAEQASGKALCYAENWIYAPAVQKQREILEKSGGQILRMLGEESHSGSHAPSYGVWAQSGGGALASKGCHPLSAALYFKFVEGRTRRGRPILPRAVSARTHRLTPLPTYQDRGHLRTAYEDTEDTSQMHVIFDDGTVADIFASDVVLGGVANWIEVFANDHRTRCNLNPIDALETFSPAEATLRDVYVVEKLSPKQGWMRPAPDEGWMHGYPQEIQAFVEAIAGGRAPESSLDLGEAVALTLYAAYLSAAKRGQEVEVPNG